MYRIYFTLILIFCSAFLAISSYMAIELGRLIENYRKQVKAYTDALESIKERMKVIESKEKEENNGRYEQLQLHRQAHEGF